MEGHSIATILQQLATRLELPSNSMRWIVSEMMAGRCGEAEAAAFLMGLRVKGETAGEVAAAAEVLREHMLAWDPGRPALDTCGTGGDGSGTFNISTATALVVAGAGVPVVKHGNRSVSSKSGSADVLAALGVKIDCDGVQARRSLEETGLAFCFAPNFHPALKHIGPIRKRLGIPTIFNCLGPLANPARLKHQLLGVGRPELLDLMAGALAKLGTTRALVVCSRDGLDEVSLSAPTDVRRIENGEIKSVEWTATTFGLDPVHLADVRVEDAAGSARVIETILKGHDGPATRLVLANAAAGLLAAEKVSEVRAGVALARQALTSGSAWSVLERLRGLADS